MKNLITTILFCLFFASLAYGKSFAGVLNVLRSLTPQQIVMMGDPSLSIPLLSMKLSDKQVGYLSAEDVEVIRGEADKLGVIAGLTDRQIGWIGVLSNEEVNQLGQVSAEQYGVLHRLPNEQVDAMTKTPFSKVSSVISELSSYESEVVGEVGSRVASAVLKLTYDEFLVVRGLAAGLPH